LLADDSVTIQRVIELTFADHDIQVLAVSDGDQAIAALQKSPPDIVLADVGMPGRTGYDVAKFVKDTPGLAHIPVVLLTGAFEPIDHDRASRAGCDGVLAKPFEPQLVIGRVKELLARPKPGTSAPGAPSGPPSATIAANAPQRPSAAVGLLPPTAPASGTKDSAQALADDYFDRLDQALASASMTGLGDTAATGREPDIPEPIDWQARPAPLPKEPLAPHVLSSATVRPFPSPGPASAPIAFPSAASSSATGGMAAAAPVPVPARRLTLPPLAEAFTALLAAEQASPDSDAAPMWPGAAVSPAPIGDALVEQVTERVLDQLSDRIVRETVTEIVSSAADRLIREEIEKIKRAIR
jgi:CheY-like chemotaxis protein